MHYASTCLDGQISLAASLIAPPQGEQLLQVLSILQRVEATHAPSRNILQVS